MTATLTAPPAGREPQASRPDGATLPADQAQRDHERWACAVPHAASPQARERCPSIMPELIVELL